MPRRIRRMTDYDPLGKYKTAVPRSSFPLVIVFIAINLLTNALCSLRSAQKALKLLSSFFGCCAPSHMTIQNWLMRFGLHRLERGVKKKSGRVWILDYTIEYGTKVCLLVIGMELSKFRARPRSISHSDVEVLAINISNKGDAIHVKNTLKEVAEKYGMPMQIVSDGGRNILKGTSDFLAVTKNNYKCVVTYDVTHKSALILQHCLEKDERWAFFRKIIGEIKRDVVHTNLAHLSPPKPREKARWANLEPYIQWGQSMLSLDPTTALEADAIEKFELKILSRIREFKLDLEEWRCMLDLANSLKNTVINYGMSKETQEKFFDDTKNIPLWTERLSKIKQDAAEYLYRECDKLPRGGRFLGCSDVIESIFGKYKLFSGKSPMKEIGKSVLAIPAFVGNYTISDVYEAMQCTTLKRVKDWLKVNIGDSIMSKRIKAIGRKRDIKSGEKHVSKSA